ncbi:hypothetical protein [Sphingopyxis flava]|uniref:Uncharacterized protein n=1 Tax=Sphingopyxis flava TaxID=1507287 RepID=A0A1T5D382_9SPHN|nr:hypothetical protein [Sphingopyxis flava]SKB66096.1 hypothetical protein SAMN06295937_1012114 [Sphingopyxis flava]
MATAAQYDAFTPRGARRGNGILSFTTPITIRNIIENDVARDPLLDRKRESWL